MKILPVSLKQRVRRFFRYAQGIEWYPKVENVGALRCLGNPKASWTVAPEFLSPSGIAFCVGVGEDISFDLQLLDQYSLQIHAFDPTPASLKWLDKQVLPSGFTAHAIGLADFDGTALFEPPADPNHVSHQLTDGTRKTQSDAITAQVRRLSSLVDMLEIHELDLLKMDIEGAEYRVVADLSKDQILPRQLLVEFHHRLPGNSLAMTKSAVRHLLDLGYKLFNVSPNGEEYSFLRV